MKAWSLALLSSPALVLSSIAGLSSSCQRGGGGGSRERAGQERLLQDHRLFASDVRFEVRLPLDGWTQRFLMVGCGVIAVLSQSTTTWWTSNPQDARR